MREIAVRASTTSTTGMPSVYAALRGLDRAEGDTSSWFRHLHADALGHVGSQADPRASPERSRFPVNL